MKYTITYQLYRYDNGKPDGWEMKYECKDASDYARCVKLYKTGEVYLTSVNGHPITTQKYYPSRRSLEIAERS